MFNSIKKDKKRRNLAKKFEIQRLQNKILSQVISSADYLSRSRKEINLNGNIKVAWQKQVLKICPRNSSKSRVQNRCIESGRSHAVLKFLRLSRIRFRDRASKAGISGVNKSSW